MVTSTKERKLLFPFRNHRLQLLFIEATCPRTEEILITKSEGILGRGDLLAKVPAHTAFPASPAFAFALVALLQHTFHTTSKEHMLCPKVYRSPGKTGPAFPGRTCTSSEQQHLLLRRQAIEHGHRDHPGGRAHHHLLGQVFISGGAAPHRGILGGPAPLQGILGGSAPHQGILGDSAPHQGITGCSALTRGIRPSCLAKRTLLLMMSMSPQIGVIPSMLMPMFLQIGVVLGINTTGLSPTALPAFARLSLCTLAPVA